MKTTQLSHNLHKIETILKQNGVNKGWQYEQLHTYQWWWWCWWCVTVWVSERVLVASFILYLLWEIQFDIKKLIIVPSLWIKKNHYYSIFVAKKKRFDKSKWSLLYHYLIKSKHRKMGQIGNQTKHKNAFKSLN